MDAPCLRKAVGTPGRFLTMAEDIKRTKQKNYPPSSWALEIVGRQPTDGDHASNLRRETVAR